MQFGTKTEKFEERDTERGSWLSEKRLENDEEDSRSIRFQLVFGECGWSTRVVVCISANWLLKITQRFGQVEKTEESE
jgi:hypothetical protein